MSKQLNKFWSSLAAGLMLGLSSAASATDIADSPLITSPSDSVLPNLLFILDDSGSMLLDGLPDHVFNAHCKGTDGNYTTDCCTNTNAGGSTPCWRDDDTGYSASSPFTYRGYPPLMANEFNTIYYSPTITYTPPKNADGTSYPSYTTWTSVPNDAYGTQASHNIDLVTKFPDMEWCTNATNSSGSLTYADCVRNDNYILPGTVTIGATTKTYATRRDTQATGTGSLISGTLAEPVITTGKPFGPHYYTILPGEYCDNINLRNCQAAASSTYNVPASLRWCTTAANAAATTPAAGSCQALYSSSYTFARYPGRFFTAAIPPTGPVAAVPASVSFAIVLTNCSSANGSARVTSVKVGATEILNGGATGYTTSATTLGGSVRTNITSASGYTDGGSNANVTLTQNTASNINGTVVTVTFQKQAGSSQNICTGSINPASPAFSGFVAAIPATPGVPAQYTGRFVRTDIVSSRTSYPKASTRTDCAGSTCSYNEEMTNFANWWAYYHTRAQMVKSSAAIAFSPVGDKYRLGFAEINATTRNRAITTFNTTTKANWYSSLFGSDPNGGTPLQAALARAGRIYAGKLSASGGSDPVQYSCQQNFTILSTDGYWNAGSGITRDDAKAVQVDGSTTVGNQDGTMPEPYKDGNGSSNNLADIAAYYYNTDLRTSGFANCTGALVPPATTGNNVCDNNVPVSGQDSASHQHMTTFTVGLGIPGYMQYQSDYETATEGDFHSIKNAVQANPAGGICSWQTTGACVWPNPTSLLEPRIDDLWHAAVNGRGKYYSARDPASLRDGLTDALAGVSVRTGTAAAATASNPNVVSGDNFIFSSTFESVKWTGQLIRQTIDISTGALSGGADWSARDQLDGNTSRSIYIFDGSAASKLEAFQWANLDATQRAYFQTPNISPLSQFCSSGTNCLSSTSQTAAAGQNLVDFLRGDRINEGGPFDSSKYYREREHLLGDIVNAEPAYVKKPVFSYTDSGYSGFKSANAGRAGTVYVAANDGMLHAFNADDGSERWAYIPTAVLPKLYKLADKTYGVNHEYFTDGTPLVSDVYIGGEWRTILVAGLNAGGRSYYALDITDPATPKALWEYTEANMGLTFGRPEISKLKDGTWVVFLTSGYNNGTNASPIPSGDGKGYLYVINAADGTLVRKISTGAGTAAGPSGLAQIRAWSDNAELNNTAQRVYGGDLLGNMWRFDVNGDVGGAGFDAHQLAAVGRPITSRPQLGDVSGTAMIYFGTGQYLGISDLAAGGTESFYAVKDTLGTVSYGNPHGDASFVLQTLTTSTCPSGSSICTAGQETRSNSNNTVNLAVNNGWYLDWPISGERSVTDSDLQLGTLAVTTNVPASDACTVGGSSYINFFDYRSGKAVSTAQNVSSVKVGNALATRPVLIRLPNNKVLSLIRLSDGTTVVAPTPVEGLAGNTRRLSWRELRTQ
ncbi:hypothetical protein D0B54_09780 [Solimonas sp. K1W22B-7]|uniref:pilus assembly protein n=1 Tax=Solimonas sp. K1W22B-7 TaxID=2303331 RepID=UPI000E330A7A|nr:PilC/PilY family type IV pilus protein [Solimonas sp. K1W22B-7]AXQ28958.1 hypothetical protein D0B54_09780 [Solimonas sp. K1W22B-7]